VLLARNLGDTSSIVTGRLVFNRADGTVDRVELPQRTLEAGETALMDARTAWGIVQEQAGDEGIGVEFEYTSAPGSVLISAGLVSGDRNLVFRVPLIDPETPKSSTGGYPWFADDARTTTVFLKNTTTTTVIYLLQVSYEGGVYAPGIKEIEPGQTLAIDIRHLRDAQVPDAFGHTIPMQARSGQVSWTVKMTTPYAMIGRAEHTDHEHGVSASYACLNCCPPKTRSVWIEDYPSSVGIGGTAGLFAMAEDEDCYQNISAAYSMPWSYLDDWYFADTGIATSYSDSTVYGVSDGETTFNIVFPGVEYHVEGTEWGWYCAVVQNPINTSGPVTTQCPVAPVAAHNPDPYPLNTQDLTQGTQNALACLQTAVSTAGGTLTVTSGYRPQSYQDHLREVWDKWQAIKNRNDNACAQTKEQVQTEWNRHGIVRQPVAVSNHTGGTAFDATWNPSSLNIDQLASGCNLSRPEPTTDPVHFVYGG
jgi:hypothetical protein